MAINNNRLKYPIDAKIIGYPENNLKLLSSYSSISSDLDLKTYVTRLYGQLVTQLAKLKENSKEYNYFLNSSKDLKNIITLLTKEKIIKSITKDQFYLWLKEFHNNQLFLGLTHQGFRFIPSIISEPFKIDIKSNYYYYLYNKDNKLLLDMIKEVQKNSKIINHFPELQDFRTYDVYKTQLFILSFLQKYKMLENYYKIRELLLIEDIYQHNG